MPNYTIRICFGHELVLKTGTSTPEEARAQARIYMQMLCPLPAWTEDNMYSTNGDQQTMTCAAVHDARGLYLWTVDVWPAISRDLV